ncbi:anti-lipopolysaccharide factor-like [Penaeus indicus]|uniref:anti-lipopolysaccharide factor-like n=1 Tax=Penaeus indicus TaxID=29960 RepID=UPI00300D20E7
MKPSVIIAMLVLVLAPQCMAIKQQKRQLIKEVAWKLLGQWMTDEAKFLGHSCDLEVQPRFSAWTLFYQCSFFCTEWTNITGEAESRCKLGAAEDAVRDFVDKAILNNLIRQVDVSNWSQEQKNVTRTF